MKIVIKLLILFLAISLTPLSFLSYIQFSTAEQEITDQIFSRLTATSLLIESQVNSEIEKHFLVLDLFSSRVLMRTSLEHFNQYGDKESQENVQNVISKAFISNPQIDAIHILNNDKIVAFEGEHRLSEEYPGPEDLFESHPFKEIDFIMKETNEGSYLHLRLMSNLLNDDSQKIGILILDFNPAKIFLGTQELGMGNSGEYIIGKGLKMEMHIYSLQVYL